MIFITNNATGRTHAITYAHNEKIYWQNVKPGKGGKYEVSMPTSWHTPMLKEGTYEKMTWGGKKRGIASLDPREGRVNILYTRAAQKFANATQKLLRHTGQELPEVITALPINPEKPTAIFGYKNTHTADVKTAFTKPSELYNKVESLGSAKKKNKATRLAQRSSAVKPSLDSNY